MDRTVMLAFPHDGHVRTDFLLSILAATTGPATPVAAIVDERTGPHMSQARTRLAAAFIKSDLEWLWMVDADMSFSARTLPALLAWADPDTRPLIGATCHATTGDGKIITTAYKGSTLNGQYGLDSLPGLPPDQLVPVDATGCACLLAHRSVFDRITKACGDVPWFAEQVIDGRPFGEDISFCLRAQEAGIQLYVHSGIRAGHVKDVQLGEVIP